MVFDAGDEVDSKEESLRETVRETVSMMSNEELARMLRAERQKYTAYALEIAREELARRSGIRSLLDSETRDKNQLARSTPARSSCYIEVWTQKNFEGEHLQIEGPAECSRLIFAELDFGDSISSIRVGAAAFVMAYTEPEFKGAMVSFGPGDEVPDLAQLSFDNRIDSLRLVNSLKIFDESRKDKSHNQAAARITKRSSKKRAGHKKRIVSSK